MYKVFNDTRNIFKPVFNKVLKYEDHASFDEAAIPAYAHTNPLIDRIFWGRLKVVLEYIDQKYDRNTNILDFGFGTGVLSYALGQKYEVVGIDIDVVPFQSIQKYITFPVSTTFIEGDLFDKEFDRKFGVVVALDVLEHMSDAELIKYIARFDTLSEEGYTLIVSGPTENRLYQLGRKLAGKRFSGEYHKTNIQSIIKTFKKQKFVCEKITKIPFIIPLFEVYAIRRK